MYSWRVVFLKYEGVVEVKRLDAGEEQLKRIDGYKATVQVAKAANYLSAVCQASDMLSWEWRQ